MNPNKYIKSISGDMRFKRIGWVAQMVLISMTTRIAVYSDGYLQDEAGANLSLDDLAIVLDMPAVELRAQMDILEAHALVCRSDEVWFIPELVRQAELSLKRSVAGRKGAQKTHNHSCDNILPRQNSSNVISLEKSKSCKSGAKKEKRTKKENNNKYIYISDRKIFTGDRGQGENFETFQGDNFTVYQREYEALQLEFPGFDEERLFELLDGHDEFMGANPAISNDNWHIPLVSGLRKLHGAAMKGGVA